MQAENGHWAPSTQDTILTAGHGITGKFTKVTSNLAFLTPSLDYSTTGKVVLDVQAKSSGGGSNPGNGSGGSSNSPGAGGVDFNLAASTPNEHGVAGALNALPASSELYGAVVGLSTAAAPIALASLDGEYHASQESARMNDSRLVREAVNQRMLNSQATPGWTGWVHAWGHWGHTPRNGNAARLDDHGSGLLIGADTRVGKEFRVGVTGGASRDHLSVSDRSSWGHEQSTWLGIYGGWQANSPLSIRSGVVYSWDKVPANRTVAFPGYRDQLFGSADGHTLTGYVEGSWTFHLHGGTVSPFVNLAHTRVTTDASTESGGAAALHAAKGSEDVTFTTLGARGRVTLAHHLDLHAELGWQRALGGTTPDRRMRLASGGPEFIAYGVPVARNAGIGRVGVGWHHGNVRVDGGVEDLSGGGTADRAAKIEVSVKF